MTHSDHEDLDLREVIEASEPERDENGKTKVDQRLDEIVARVARAPTTCPAKASSG